MSMEKHIIEFLAAVSGKRGDLDCWLECNNEEEVRAAVNGALHEKDEIILAQQARITELETTPPDKREDLRCVISDLCHQVRERDEKIVAQQARIKQLKESALRILRNKRGDDDWLILTIDCVGLEETLSIPDDLSALREHDAELLAPYQWQPIETAPKGELIAIWIVGTNKNGQKWSDEEGECWLYCYHDNICGDWRTTRPSGHLRCVPDRFVTHWMPLPSAEAIEASEIALRIKTEEHQCCTEDLMEVRRSACECADTRAKL